MTPNFSIDQIVYVVDSDRIISAKVTAIVYNTRYDTISYKLAGHTLKEAFFEANVHETFDDAAKSSNKRRDKDE